MITTFSVAVVAHCPASGVNVYVPFAVVLIVAGLHVPVMTVAMIDEVGSGGVGLPLHSRPMAAKVVVV